MAVLEPELCILDESDSGLDIDALKIVSEGVNSLRDGKRAFIIVTHYQRILDYIKPDYVHVLYQGRIVKSGDFTLVKQLEEQGLWLAYRTAVTRCSSGIICLKHRAKNARRRPISICNSCCARGCRRANMKNWKYTPLDALLSGTFVATPATLSVAQRDALALNLDARRMVFVDGRFSPALSDDLTASGFDVSVDNQRQHLPDAVQPEVFLHLTESLAQTVTRIDVKRNQRPEKPLLLMHITSGLAGDELNTAHYRHHLALESGAQATIIEHYISLDEQRHFTGGRLTMAVADNAHLQHIKLAFEKWAKATTSPITICCLAAMLRHSAAASCWAARCYDTIPVPVWPVKNSNLRINSLAMPVKKTRSATAVPARSPRWLLQQPSTTQNHRQR